ncbi:MAG: hypothetical protein CVU81_02390, partial [Euryarchaeota archaeon HGW-Euryarchaeota-1]
MNFTEQLTKTNFILFLAVVIGAALFFQLASLLVLAGLLSYFLLPAVNKLNKIVKKRALSAFLVMGAGLTTILGIIIYSGAYLIKNIPYNIIELQYAILQNLDKGFVASGMEGLKIPVTNLITNVFAQISTSVSQLGSKGATLAGDSLVYGIIFIFALYYFLKDGPQINESIRRILTFEHHDRIKLVVEKGIKNVVLLQVVYAVIAVILSTPLYLALHIPFLPLVLICLSIVCFIPKIGPTLVYIPISFYLLISGNTIGALIVLLHGLLILSTVDDYLRVKFAGAFELHPLMVLIGYAGGFMLFGILG